MQRLRYLRNLTFLTNLSSIKRVQTKGLNKEFKKLNSYNKLKFNQTSEGKRVK